MKFHLTTKRLKDIIDHLDTSGIAAFILLQAQEYYYKGMADGLEKATETIKYDLRDPEETLDEISLLLERKKSKK